MALSLSTSSLSSARLSASFSSHPSQSARFHFVTLSPVEPHRKRIAGFSISSYLRRSRSSRGFRSYLSLDDAGSRIDESTEDSQANEKASQGEFKKDSLPSIEALIKVYREAVLAGDEKTASEIETTFCRIENKKNELLQRVSSLGEEITSGKEKYIRLQADFDNFRKRSEKERLMTRNDAQGEVIESLLSMVDNFERAKQQLRLETDKEKKIDASYQGIYKQFVEIMRSFQVSAIATVGKPFDPSLHEAIAREASEEFKEGVVIQEFRRGFLFGDRLLRPAMVKVSSGPGEKKGVSAAGATKAAGPAQQSEEQPATAGGADGR